MKIATWNINCGYGLNPANTREFLGYENLDYFIEHLRHIDADVVCLQEIHANATRSQTHEIADALGYTSVFQSIASESHIDPNFQLANAILAKQPFQTTRSIMLPQPSFPLDLPILASGERATIHDKVLQVVQLNGFTVANTHLLPLHILGARWDSAEGKTFAATIARLIENELQPPLIFCGDFNYPDVKTIMPELVQALTLTDVLSDESSLPHLDARVDYIFVSSGINACSSEILHCFSDHFPCVAVVNLPLAM